MAVVDLESLRLARRWTKAELARRSGLNASTVGLIESGRLVPYEPQVEKLAAALGVPPQELSFGSDRGRDVG